MFGLLTVSDQEWQQSFPLPSTRAETLDVCIVRERHRPYYRYKTARTAIKRNLKSVESLTPTERMMYDLAVSVPNFWQVWYHIRTADWQEVLHTPGPVSGRIIDTLLTRFAEKYPATYYAWVNPAGDEWEYIGPDMPTVQSPGETREIYQIKVSALYQWCVALYTKSFFDPFGRGVEVCHYEPQQKRYVALSLCQFVFYYVALRYHLLDYMKDVYGILVQEQRRSSEKGPRGKRKRDTKNKKALRGPSRGLRLLKDWVKRIKTAR